MTTISVELGPRALAIDAKDNVLVVTNEGSGTLVLIDLSTNTVTGKIDVVSTSGSDNDDHGDRDNGVNLPAVQSVSPASSMAGVTLSITISGSGLMGATGVVFDVPPGNGDQGNNGNDKNQSDNAFKVSNIVMNSAGTQLTATLTIGAAAHTGQHVVRVTTLNGESSGNVAAGDIFTISQ